MSTPKPQQPTGSQDETDDLISELARMMGTGPQDAQPAAEEEAAPVAVTPAAEPQPDSAVRIPGETARPAATPSSFKFDFGAPPSAPSVAAPAPLLNWQDRLSRSAAPSSSVRLEPTLERVPVEPKAEMPSFVAPAQPEPAGAEPPPVPEPTPTPAPAPVSDHDAIADLIAAEFDVPAGDEPVAPEPEPELQPDPEVAKAPEPPAAKPLLRATNFPVQPKPENDRFASPPVFGAGGRPIERIPEVPVPVQAEAHPEPKPVDPMDEIESLIGAAVQADRGIRPVVTPPSAPRPVAGATPAMNDEAAYLAAESAILAAAAATGVQISRVAAEPSFDETPEPANRQRQRAPKVERERRERRGGVRPFIGPVVAAVLLVAAGLGLYWVLGLGHGSDGTAPLLTADNSPAKEAPPTTAPAAATPNSTTSAVFNELDGVAPTTDDEQLVSRDQSTGTEATPAPVDTNDDGDGLANRKVRTVTVRPDGSIVETSDSLAGSQALPVERPNVPDVPGGSLDNSDLLTAAAQQPASITPATPPVTATPGPVAGATPTPSSVVAPVPMPRPSDRASLQQPSSSVTAIVAPASQGGAPTNDLIGNLAAQNSPPATPAATPSGTSAPAYVQLSSQRDQNVAQQSLVGINQRYGTVLKGVLPEVQRVDLGAKGIYYRVRVPADSLQSANYLCSQIKAANGDCLVTN